MGEKATGLVKRLRNRKHIAQHDGLAALIMTCDQAADRIKALEAENSRLRISWWDDMRERGVDQDLALAKISAALKDTQP